MNIEHLLFPKGSLPPLPFLPAGQCVEWLNHTEDTKENYAKRRGHSIYGKHDITYCFNSLGYRSIEFNAKAETKVLAIGCSYVMGVGLRQQDLFHEVFAEKLRQ